MLPNRLKALYDALSKKLEIVSTEVARQESRIILVQRTGFDWADIIAHPDREIDKDTLDLIQKDLQERLHGKPVSRIYGIRSFWGLDFEVTRDTLDPRADTETIIERALELYKDNPPETILDMGSGTGCILIALLKEFPHARGVALDISPAALAIARKNAISHGLEDRIEFIEGGWKTNFARKFDLVVSNPPYISNQELENLPVEVKNHDPILALEGGEDGLDPYKEIFSHLKNILKPEKFGLFEIAFNQSEDVMRLAEFYGFTQRCVHHDIAGQPRVVEISCGDK
ncbi:MAG: peptide chain release factor N(5)-glutamine methyltransferase [Alphaproteobacteria bacterium]|nr:peptide chain release factor N(5)-glutamine methyltransferase [Alphaproteobacteria bacterium]